MPQLTSLKADEDYFDDPHSIPRKKIEQVLLSAFYRMSESGTRCKREGNVQGHEV